MNGDQQLFTICVVCHQLHYFWNMVCATGSAVPANDKPPPVPQRSTNTASTHGSTLSVKSCESQIGNMSIDGNADPVKGPSAVDDISTVSSNKPHIAIENYVPEDIGSNLLSVLRNSLNSDEAKCRSVCHNYDILDCISSFLLIM